MRSELSLLRNRLYSSCVRQLGLVALFWIAALSCVNHVAAQPLNNPPAGRQNALIGPGQPQNALFPNNANVNTGQQGGAANADFDSLIELITATVTPESWVDNGGTGDVRPYPGGVLVDTAGMLRLRERTPEAGLAAKRGQAFVERSATSDARQRSALRYVSLPRLEREIARRQKSRQKLTPEMLTLAGLQRVQYVFVYPESGDVVLAGPAGDWFVDPDGRILSTNSKQPVVRLDDLLVLLRRGPGAAESHFGCSINPRQEALAKTQAFLASSSQKPLEPGQRPKWLRDVRNSVGAQDIEVFGIDPATRVASVLVEADYHMKLIGMGLAEGVDGVESYLASIKLAPGESPPAMSVLRWWFTLNYDGIASTPERDAFELMGQGVRVLSENELLAAQGKRVHTGQSDPLNRQFAESFTAHFAELAQKYPVYGELRNIFDLAMAVALIESEDLVTRAGWQPGRFFNGEQLRLPQAAAPRQVETVINHRVINRRHVVAGVSGGVMVAPADVLREGRTEDSGALSRLSAVSSRPNGKRQAVGESWWWDAAD